MAPLKTNKNLYPHRGTFPRLHSFLPCKEPGTAAEDFAAFWSVMIARKLYTSRFFIEVIYLQQTEVI